MQCKHINTYLFQNRGQNDTFLEHIINRKYISFLK